MHPNYGNHLLNNFDIFFGFVFIESHYGLTGIIKIGMTIEK